MRVYKGFNKKIQAKHGKGTFQYEKGKTYKEEKSKTRSTGFHAAEYILYFLQWYPNDGKNKFFLCEAGRKKSNDRMEKRRSGTMIWYSALPAENW